MVIIENFTSVTRENTFKSRRLNRGEYVKLEFCDEKGK